MKKYLLFDLDGTLTDPKVGITTCVQYALRDFGIEEPDLEKLEPFIGPPLRESFQKFYGLSPEQAEAAVAKYRERFQDTGIFENEVYDGIPQMLRILQSKGMHLAVASSKPEVFVKRILEHFQIDKYFQVVVGSELDGTRDRKEEVVREALDRLFGDQPIPLEEVYMIGDRSYDVEGADALGVESVGVTYGYGSMEELKEAKADYIVRSVGELQKFLLRGSDEVQKEEQPTKKNPMAQRIWTMVYCFIMFLLFRNIAMYALNWLLLQIGPGLQGMVGDFLIVKDETGEIIAYTGNATTLMTAVGFIVGILPIWGTAKQLIDMTKEETKLAHLKAEPVQNYLLIGLATVGAVIGLNLLLELSGVTNKSEVYQAVVEDQYSAHFLIGIFCYGIISPIAEELLFRGVIFSYMRRFLNIRLAVVLSALVFGVYHGNAVQGGYAFIMGCLIAYSYEYFGTFCLPLAIHMISNILSYCLSYTGLAVGELVSWPVCVIFMVIGVGSIYFLNKRKKVL